MKKKLLSIVLLLTVCATLLEPMIVGAEPVQQTEIIIEDDLESVSYEISEESSEMGLKNLAIETAENTSDETLENSIDEIDVDETEGHDLPDELAVVDVATGSYNISTAMDSNQMLTIDRGSVTSGATTLLWNKSKPYNQNLQIIEQSDGWYVIYYPHSGFVLDVYAGYTGNGGNVQQYKKNGSDAQMWRFEDAGDGYVYIRSKLGTYLDCTAGQKFNGTVVQTYTLNKTIAQKWKISDAQGWMTIDDQKVFYEGGSAVTGWRNIDGKNCYLNNGIIADGFLAIDGNTYYFDNGQMLKGWQTIDGEDYYFDVNGIMQVDCVIDGVQLDADGKAVYIEREVEAGVYMISIYDQDAALSVCSGAREDGVAMELDIYGYKVTQQYDIKEVEDGWYTITNMRSNKVLTVKDNSNQPGATVEQRTYSGLDGQKWQFVEAGDGYCYLKSKLGTVLDCPAGSMIPGTLLNMYSLNGTKAQKWKVELAKEPDLVVIEDGIYQISGCNTDGKALSVSNYSREAWASVTLNTPFGHPGEQFEIKAIGNGWYSIINVNSGKAFDVIAANAANWASVHQYDYNGTDAQQWRFIDAGNGYVYIQSKVGTVLDRPAGSSAEGTILHMYSINHTEAQKWVIEDVPAPKTYEVENGAVYLIETALKNSQLLDVTNSSKDNWANVQLSQESAKTSQQFKAVEVEDGWYKLESVNSGKVLDVYASSKENGANVQQYEWNGSDAQLWRFIDAGNGYCYIQSKLGTVLDCVAGKGVNGTNIQTYTPNRTKAQMFKLYNISGKDYVHITTLSDYTKRITLYSPSVENIKVVEFPTWSNVNGQDDVKWLQGTKNADGSWSVIVDSKTFDAEETFELTTHIYANKTDGTAIYVKDLKYDLKQHIEGWVYVDGYRLYRNDDGTYRNDVSDIFNPSNKRITVDCYRGITTIYGYNVATKSYDTPIRAFWCSVGRVGSKQTPSGTYSIYRKYESKIMNGSDGSYSVWAPYISCFNGPIYFHGVASVGRTPNQIASDNWLALGTPKSSGCVRLAGIEAKWLYENCSIGTLVTVGSYNKALACPITNPTRYPWISGGIGPDPSLE